MNVPDSNASRDGWGATRSRTVTWQDPGPGTAAGLAMSGVDYIRAVVDGVLPTPPLESQMGFRFRHVEQGCVVVTCAPDESLYNGLGTVHGGLLCALLDVVAGSALLSTLPVGKGYTSLEIKISYLKSAQAKSGMLTGTGKVVRAGSRVGFTEALVRDDDGRPIAAATSTLLVFDLER